MPTKKQHIEDCVGDDRGLDPDCAACRNESAMDHALALLDAFETRTRDNGETFLALKEGHPEWMTDCLREAHGDMMPDNTRYRMIREVVSALTERDEDEWDDAEHEICDGLVDVYTSRLTAWLASHLDRVCYCDEAQFEGLVRDNAGVEERMRVGQFLEYQEIYRTVVVFLRERAEDLAADDETEVES